MKRASLLSGVALAAMPMQSPLAAEEIKPVFRHELPDAAGKALTVVEVNFPPGDQADAHRHGQAFVFAYVLSGTVRSQFAGGPARTYRAGESWFEPPGARHVLTQNLSRTASARLLVAFVAAPDEPLKTGCHKGKINVQYNEGRGDVDCRRACAATDGRCTL